MPVIIEPVRIKYDKNRIAVRKSIEDAAIVINRRKREKGKCSSLYPIPINEPMEIIRDVGDFP